MSDQSALDGATTCLLRLAAAVALGVEDQIRRAAGEALAAGLPEGWVDELILQSVLMAGWPRALVAMGIWRSVSGSVAPPADADGDYSRAGDWVARGERTCRQVYGSNYDKLRANVRSLHPALDAWMVAEGYGRTLSRPALGLALRELCTVVQTAVLDVPQQLHSHLRGALNAGAAVPQIDQALRLVRPGMTDQRWRQVERLWSEVREGARDMGQDPAGGEGWQDAD